MGSEARFMPIAINFLVTQLLLYESHDEEACFSFKPAVSLDTPPSLTSEANDVVSIRIKVKVKKI